MAQFDTGIKYPITVDTISEDAGACVWVTASAVISDNAGYAGVTAASFDTGILSHLLRTRNYNISVPATATVTGFLVEAEAYDSAGAAGDADVVLTKTGTARVGEDKATGAGYPSSPTIFTYGSSTDLWATTWAVADVTSPSFGVLYKMSASAVNTDGFLDFIRITTYYDWANPSASVTPPTMSLFLTENEAYLNRIDNVPVIDLKLGEQIPYLDKGFISPTMNLKTTPQTSTLDRTDNVPVLDLGITERQPTLNKSQNTSTLGLGTGVRVPSTNRGFITQLLGQGLILLIPVVTTSGGGTTATPPTLELVLTEIAGQLNREFNTQTLDLKLTEQESYLQKEFGVPIVTLGTGRRTPIINREFLPPTIALNTTLRDYNINRVLNSPLLILTLDLDTPVVTAVGGTTATPGLIQLILSLFSPNVSIGNLPTPGTATLTTAGYIPKLWLGINPPPIAGKTYIIYLGSPPIVEAEIL